MASFKLLAVTGTDPRKQVRATNKLTNTLNVDVRPRHWKLTFLCLVVDLFAGKMVLGTSRSTLAAEWIQHFDRLDTPGDECGLTIEDTWTVADN